MGETCHVNGGGGIHVGYWWEKPKEMTTLETYAYTGTVLTSLHLIQSFSTLLCRGGTVLKNRN
jgi:hypothetical protein